MSTDPIPSHCVIIPFLNRLQQVGRCVNALLAQLTPTTILLLIDDGSSPACESSPYLQAILRHHQVRLIKHPTNYGVSAARNSGLHWCRQREFDIVIMIDSDCLPDANVIDEHLRLHRDHPEAACIGAAIVGQGRSLWARIDGIASWVHAMPDGDFHYVAHPYHLATTNFSAKLPAIPARDFVFEERLATGEDCLLIREIRRKKQAVYFSPKPSIVHFDREDFWSVCRHHYRWGHHQYFIQLGGDLSERCFNPLYRAVFFLCFFLLAPVFAMTGSALNLKPWLKTRPGYLLYYPFILFLWCAKSIAVLEASLRPRSVLCPARNAIAYDEVKSKTVPHS
ncbi:MAG: glycosyltransferase [Halioglobus sp.]|nr:glycosyltransferase [Halioglobus sp.]